LLVLLFQKKIGRLLWFLPTFFHTCSILFHKIEVLHSNFERISKFAGQLLPVLHTSQIDTLCKYLVTSAKSVQLDKISQIKCIYITTLCASNVSTHCRKCMKHRKLSIATLWCNKGSFYVHPCCHTGPRFIWSHEGRAPMSKRGVRMGDVKIIRSLCRRSNHCATRVIKILIAFRTKMQVLTVNMSFYGFFFLTIFCFGQNF
jgi:hypothetical protein